MARWRYLQVQLLKQQPMPHKRILKQLPIQRKEENKMNYDNQRLKTIQKFKAFYHQKLKEEPTELGESLIQAKIQELDNEEKQILQRFDVKI